jgi:hypothetical protein
LDENHILENMASQVRVAICVGLYQIPKFERIFQALQPDFRAAMEDARTPP